MRRQTENGGDRSGWVKPWKIAIAKDATSHREGESETDPVQDEMSIHIPEDLGIS